MLIGLVDCNNFYASCERVFRPELIGRPVVVLSNNDGCVVSRSNEARALGIPMGAPIFQLQPLVRKYGVVVCSSNYTLYGDLSRRVMNIIRSMVHDVEVYSIDECFVRFKNEEQATEMAPRIRRALLKGVGIPTCVGIAETKTLAKLANHVAKKEPAHKGVFFMREGEQHDYILANIEIEEVWGIGRRTTEKMKRFGIYTPKDFLSHTPLWVKKNFTKTGLDTYYELQGTPRLLFNKEVATKSIGRSRSFEFRVESLSLLNTLLLEFTNKCCEELQAKGLATRRVIVYISTDRFRTDLAQQRQAAEAVLMHPTNSEVELMPVIYQLAKGLFRKGYEYKKAGVVCVDLVQHQQVLEFEDNERERLQEVELVERHMKEKYGSANAFFSATRDPDILSKMARRHLSQRHYTTQLDDIIEVFAK